MNATRQLHTRSVEKDGGRVAEGDEENEGDAAKGRTPIREK
jgi:hypothetical protein